MENDKNSVNIHFWSFLGAVGVVITAHFIVDSASYIAENVGIPRVVIGATVVAFGTSVPELATCLDATKKGHLDLALGNIIGSCFININLYSRSCLGSLALKD